jgi:hypothetical protein
MDLDKAQVGDLIDGYVKALRKRRKLRRSGLNWGNLGVEVE